MSENTQILQPDEIIMEKIYLIRGQKVMLDTDLADLYGVETRTLKQAVRRNIKRFPDDFMFELIAEENNVLRSHFGTSRRGGHSKYLPFAFTEQGVAMLSSILNSDRAIMVNIQIIRIFVRIREMMSAHKDLLLHIDEIEKKLSQHDDKILLVFEYLKQLERSKQEEFDQHNRPKIGFKTSKQED